MKLFFVYNANSGMLNAIFDAGHKLFSPTTYPCSLCAITYGTFSENTIWKSFRRTNNLEMVFLHKDEFEKHFPNQSIVYPAILKLDNELLYEVLNKKALDETQNVHHLIERLQAIL